MNTTHERTDGDPAVEVDNLVKTYGDGDDAVTAVDGVSLEIERGSIVGILGENGAGKTTLIKSIFGMISPDSGQITVASESVGRHPTAVYGRAAAVLEGARNIYWRLTVEENLAFFARLGGYSPDEQRAYHDELLEKLDMADRRDTVVNELSRGMKQKVSLATILARRPEVLFLDEPTLGLDVESSVELRTEIRRLVTERDMTVLVSSHDMDVIEKICDRVVILRDGRVVADDTVKNLLSSFEGNRLQIVTKETPEGLRDRLVEHHEIESWTRRDDRVRATFSVADDAEIHELLGRVVETDCRLADLQTEQTDFEDVFLRVTNDARAATTTR
jgi:ABC-2 type transport system ATP-binding protein